MAHEDSLLEFLKNKQTIFANYQPIVIKLLLEKGTNKNFSASLDEIQDKIILLNFDRVDFKIKNAIVAVLPALKNYVSEKEGSVLLDRDSFSDDEIDECLKICGDKILQQHVDNLMNKKNQCYFIRAGENEKYWKKFKTNNFVAVDYLEKEGNPNGDFNLFGMTKDEIINRNGSDKNATELFDISQIKKGDIIAVVNDLKTVEEFAIAKSNYYFQNSVNENKHRVDVEYLNFGTSKIGNPVSKGIMKDAQNKIKDFLTEDKLEYFMLRHAQKGKEEQTWNDEIGKIYHIGRQIDGNMGHNVQKLRDVKVGSKAVWISDSIKNSTYVLGYGAIKSIETRIENKSWNVVFENFIKFEDDETSPIKGKKMSDLFLSQLQLQVKASKSNWQHSVNKISKKLYQQIIGGDLTPEEDELDAVTEHSRTIDILKRKKNIILYGPPGTGKTFTAKEIAKQMNGITKSVTFHQSYGYEEFIEGIRPQPIGNVITYPVKPGVFKKFCQSLPRMNWRQAAIYVLNEKDASLHYTEITKISIELEIEPIHHPLPSGVLRKTPWNTQLRAMSEDVRINNQDSIFKKSLDDDGKEIPGMYNLNKESSNYNNEITELESLKNNYLDVPKILIIDEINRGNISKIFGELITIIENNKRGDEVTLAYSGEPFSVPSNVFIIGTMNTADQSLTHIDAALKRRFSSIEVMPDSSILKKGMKGLPELLDKINEKVREKISRDNQIGHSYFMTEDGKPIIEIKELQFVFATDIIPLLRDYFYDSDDDLKEVLGEQFLDWNEGSDRNIEEDWQNSPETFRAAIKKAYDVTI